MTALIPTPIDGSVLVRKLTDSINNVRRQQEASTSRVEPPATANGTIPGFGSEAAPPQANPTLFDLEEHLTALEDSADMVEPGQEQQFLADFRNALAHAADKRDRVAGMLAKLENQQEFAAAEIERLQAFKANAKATQARIEGYVAYCIEALGRDAKGKYRKLEGNTSTLFLRACPVSVDVTDDRAVPLNYQNATVTMPAFMWLSVLDALDGIDPKPAASFSIDKRAVKAAIEGGEDVPGAHLVTDKTKVGRK